jgi:hypothetical protein
VAVARDEDVLGLSMVRRARQLPATAPQSDSRCADSDVRMCACVHVCTRTAMRRRQEALYPCHVWCVSQITGAT